MDRVFLAAFLINESKKRQGEANSDNSGRLAVVERGKKGDDLRFICEFDIER